MALTNIHLTVASGTVCAVLGPTNSGKTTLLHAIAGTLGSHHHDALSAGSIGIGEQLFRPLPRSVLFPTIGLTIQDPYYQISGLRDSVGEEVALTLESLDVDHSEIQSRVTKLLESLGISHLATRKPATLSGGELQRVALANILIAEPSILLLDEPANSLDGTSLHRLAAVVSGLKGSSTIVIADSQIDLALMVADQIVVMDGGRLVFSGDRIKFIESLPMFSSLLPVDTIELALTALAAIKQKDWITRLIDHR